MRHPSAYYVKYLLVTMWDLVYEAFHKPTEAGVEKDPRDKILAEVNGALSSFGLPEIHLYALSDLVWGFGPPFEVHLDDPTDVNTVEFMQEEKLTTIWQPTEDMERTLLEVVGNRRISHTIHLLLMGDVPHDIIAEKVSIKFRLREPLSPGMIDCYAHYFWKASNMNEREWGEFLALDMHRDQLMASLLCGEQQALFRAGFNPKYDYKQASRDTHRQISFRIQFLGHLPDDKLTVSQLLKLSREQRALYDLLYGEGGSLEEQVKEIRRFMMEHKDPGVKPLEELVGENGSHSEDGED